MRNDSQIEAIQARHREIAQEIERLQKEADELDVALRVLRRFAPAEATAENAEPKLGPPRPEGAPTLYEMAITVIRDAEAHGQPGLTGQEIVQAIGERYWPGVKGRQILPSIYQFAKKGRLRKNGGRFQSP